MNIRSIASASACAMLAAAGLALSACGSLDSERPSSPEATAKHLAELRAEINRHPLKPGAADRVVPALGSSTTSAAAPVSSEAAGDVTTQTTAQAPAVSPAPASVTK